MTNKSRFILRFIIQVAKGARARQGYNYHSGSILLTTLVVILVAMIGGAALMTKAINSLNSSSDASDLQTAKEAAETGFNEILAALNTDERSYLLVTCFTSWGSGAVSAADLDTNNIYHPSSTLAAAPAGYPGSQSFYQTPGFNGVVTYKLEAYDPPASVSTSATCTKFGNLFGGSASFTVIGTLTRNGKQQSTFRLKKVVFVRGPFSESSQPFDAPLMITGSGPSSNNDVTKMDQKKFGLSSIPGACITAGDRKCKSPEPGLQTTYVVCSGNPHCVPPTSNIGPLNANGLDLPPFPGRLPFFWLPWLSPSPYSYPNSGPYFFFPPLHFPPSPHYAIWVEDRWSFLQDFGAAYPLQDKRSFLQLSSDQQIVYNSTMCNFPYYGVTGCPTPSTADSFIANKLEKGCYYNHNDQPDNSGDITRPSQNSSDSTAINCVVKSMSNPNIKVNTGTGAASATPNAAHGLPVNVFVTGTGTVIDVQTGDFSNLIPLNWAKLRIHGTDGDGSNCSVQTVLVGVLQLDGLFIWMPEGKIIYPSPGGGGGNSGPFGVRWVCAFDSKNSANLDIIGPSDAVAGLATIFPSFFNASAADPSFIPSSTPSNITNYRAYGVTY